eukprot:2053213-Prymnesium_polylepis.1
MHAGEAARRRRATQPHAGGPHSRRMCHEAARCDGRRMLCLRRLSNNTQRTTSPRATPPLTDTMCGSPLGADAARVVMLRCIHLRPESEDRTRTAAWASRIY